LEKVATLIPTKPDKIDVMAPAKNAKVVQADPKVGSTKKKMTNAMTRMNANMNLYSAARKALAPLSM
jgi:hypothetical protein